MPLFFPVPSYVPCLSLSRSVTLRELCALAGVRCRASGDWVGREVEIISGRRMQIVAEPGDWGKVRLVVKSGDRTQQARIALAIMAYVIHDLVAKESIKGEPWSRISPPRGRPKTGRALTLSERQRKFRATAA